MKRLSSRAASFFVPVFQYGIRDLDYFCTTADSDRYPILKQIRRL